MNETMTPGGIKLRALFTKTGKAVYISHLDLMRVMQRGFTRAEIPVKYSEGFNPHSLISLCLPLSVGAASVCELMDFRVTRPLDLDAVPEKLSAALPDGIDVLRVYPQERKITELKWLAVEGVFEYDNADAAKMAAGLREFFGRESLPVTRRTKRGEGVMDLSPNIKSVAFSEGEGCVLVDAVISAQDPTVNPELLISAAAQLAPELSPDFARFTRREIYDENMCIYR